MPNSLFELLSRQTPRSNPNANSFASFIQNFNQFRSQFTGDPKKKVEELLQSGQMTKEQFDQFSNIANQFTGRK